MPVELPQQPHMDEAGLARFKEALKWSQCYLEYGSGGSTIYANNVAAVGTILSVETDRDWAQAVAGALENSGSRTMISHCDIGPVGKWGAPKGTQHMQRFWHYMVTPWEMATRHNLVPDVVLIDGRFRVASFLFSLLSARKGTVILFDDYLNRPEYFVAEQFCRLESRHGRMGLFTARHDFSQTAITAKIAEYCINPA